MKRNRNPIPIGTKFGNLTVVSLAPSKIFKNGTARQYRCQCKCGKQTTVIGGRLKSGVTRSCGCMIGVVHGESRTGAATHEYKCLAHIIQRCTNPKHKHWKHYGGRGITVCERWNSLSKIGVFIKDAGRAPSPNHSIDRKDTNGNYEPGNVRWSTRKEQNRNKRDNRWIKIGQETKCLKDWMVHFKTNEGRFYYRTKRLGWSDQKALKVPSIGRWGKNAKRVFAQ